MKKIIVSKDACIGCGACVAIDPEHFEFNDEGLSSAMNQENLESEALLNAIDSCPTSAISISDCDDNETCDCDDNETCECDDACECDECHCNGCHCTNED